MAIIDKLLILSFKIINRLITVFDRMRGIYLKNSVTANGKITFGKTSQVLNASHDRAKITVGDGTLIDGILQVFPFGEGISIGTNCYIGQNSRIWSADRITIGNNVLVSHNCNIIDTNSHEICTEERIASSIKQLSSGGLPKTKGNVKTAPIEIGDNVWISFNVTILKGVKIGSGSIIGCGATVTQDIPENSIVFPQNKVITKQLD